MIGKWQIAISTALGFARLILLTMNAGWRPQKGDHPSELCASDLAQIHSVNEHCEPD